MSNNPNLQQKNSQDSIKSIRDNVIETGRETQSLIVKLKQRFASLNESVAAREAIFRAEEEAKRVSETQAEAEPEEKIESPSTENDQTAVKENEVVPPVLQKETKSEVPVKESRKEKIDEKPSHKEEPKAVVKEKAASQTRVVVTVENGREVKTYTDEKGNVRVRKFLDTTPKKPVAAAPHTASSSPRTGARPYDPKRPQTGAPFNRTGTVGAKPVAGKKPFGSTATAELPKPADGKFHGNKNKTHEHGDDKRPTKKNLITRDYSADYDEDKIVRRAKRRSLDGGKTSASQKITHAVVNLTDVPIKMLSEKIGVTASEIIKQLFKENILKRINDTVDFDYAAYVAGMYGVELELKADKTAEETIAAAEQDDGLKNDVKRPPIVTVMGHVDHGKTSLLDAIRKTNVTGGEAGGITQHIGAYTVSIHDRPITFIDTPGHAAFTAMRARGAKITDVAIIVVAADDGVMPQTIEAINHAKAAGVAIVVAMNKMDKPDISVDKLKQQLADQGLLCEDWGGETVTVPVSAKTGLGIEKLLESVLVIADMLDLKANSDKRATGTVVEAKLDKGRGPVATVLVSNGTLNVGDNVIAGFATGKIRAMFDDKGKKVKSAGPSVPVEVLGFSDVPQAGDYMYVADEKLVKKAAEERKNKVKIESARQAPAMNLGDLFGKISEGQLKTLNLIIKTDVQGSLEALRSSLEKISNDEVKVCPIHGGVGAVNETDIMLARASDAIIIGFNVRADANAKLVAEKEGVDIRTYNVIYDAVDDVTKAMKGMLTPKFTENILGAVEVREVFRITGVGTVAGGYVTNGKAVRNGKVRVYRDDVKIYDGNVLALKRFKDDVKEVAAGYECGISVENYNDIKVGDVFEIYQMEEIEQ